MSFPLNLALFTFLLIRSPTNIINYNQDTYTNGVPSFQQYEYQNDTLLFQSYEEPEIRINGSNIMYNIGYSALNDLDNYTNSLYFSYLPTISYNYDLTTNSYYWNELYSPLYIGNGFNVSGENKDLFRIDFDLFQTTIDISFCMDLNNMYDKLTTWKFLNNEFAYVNNDINKPVKSYYYNYTIILQAYYGAYDEDSMTTFSISDYYTINLKNIYNSSYPNIPTNFRKIIAKIPTNKTSDKSILAIKMNVLYESYKQIDKTSYNNGYNDGFEKGIQSELNPNNWIYSFVRSTFNGLSDILNVEVLPNVTIGTFVAIPLVFAVIMFILSFFKKGG